MKNCFGYPPKKNVNFVARLWIDFGRIMLDAAFAEAYKLILAFK